MAQMNIDTRELIMKRARVLALILAGGTGKRMDVLTEMRAKPALPYAGVYRLIDFPLSNCVHSDIADVWVIEQFEPRSLNDHLANGRPWDLDRTYGGLQILQPHMETNEGGFHQGNADAIYRNRRFIREFEPDILLVLSADHIYKLDYSKVIEEHMAHNADVTMVITKFPIEQASRFGNVKVNEDGRVVDFEYKPESPQSDLVTTEVFAYNARKLLDTLDQLTAQKKEQEDNAEAALEDFGHELIPRLVEEGRAYSYLLEGYWRDVGTIESYWQSHMDLLASEPPLDLDEKEWPILTYGVQRMPAHIYASARLENSLISPGCEIRGEVINSVLAPSVVVEEGAVIRDTVILQDTIVGPHAKIECAIVDSEVEIGAGVTIGSSDHDGRHDKDGPERRITLVGFRARISAGKSIPAGERVRPEAQE
jgi:glucose-1-phosphate adenylyltransferase